MKGMMKEAGHDLWDKFTILHMQQPRGSRARQWTSLVKPVGPEVSTVEQFWSIYSRLAKPDSLPHGVNYFVFRGGIMPYWEDPGNEGGGRWTLRLKKGLATLAFEELVLALLGGSIPEGDQVCGVAINIRLQDDLAFVWTKQQRDSHGVYLDELFKDVIGECVYSQSKPWTYRSHSSEQQQASTRDPRQFRAGNATGSAVPSQGTSA
ncbi:Eukaryotic translation initiation factor NCBP [Porphyridium purpureum]|uniref:Eukaryotic translation initiation factor NCBP n=1 Tax=Porphyridium purpureum TaxID=35688 RepID=A0A5J4YMI5_PORPP|nr:Eukaryotic translation initiation factor NCBP [Porphyridium purpureum]|eukprot:POR6794..scf249_10